MTQAKIAAAQPIIDIPLSQLSIDEKVNVRKTGRDAEPVFVGSIEAHGVIEPVIVRKNGKGYTVTNGGKRLAALQWMHENGRMAKGVPVTPEFTVPAMLREEADADAMDTSLITNIVRSDTHPVDIYEHFAGLIRAGRSKEEIGATYAKTPLQVDQVLALGNLTPEILAAWREGTIDEEAAKLFTLCPSKKAQVAIFEQLKKRGTFHPYNIRQALNIGHDNPGRYLNFVGVEAYERRGGKVTRDLFGSNHVVSDAKLMAAMVAEKMDETCKQLVAEGWAWAIPTPQDQYRYGDLQGKAKIPAELVAEQKKLEKEREAIEDSDDYDSDAEYAIVEKLTALEAKIERVAYTPQQKASAGCFITLEDDGTLALSFGKVKPEEKRAVAAAERKTTPSGNAAPKPSQAKEVSNALADRLRDQFREAVKKALKANSATGLLLTLQTLTAKMIRNYGMPDDVERALTAIADGIAPRVMNEALRKEFNRQDYFGNAPIPVLLGAIADAVSADQAAKLKTKKKAELVQFCLANVAKTKWLPAELRTANYDGPAAKAKKK